MCGIFTYDIWFIFMVDVGKYTIHVSYGISKLPHSAGKVDSGVPISTPGITWQLHSIHGRNLAKQVIGSHYLPGFIHPRWLGMGFLNHQPSKHLLRRYLGPQNIPKTSSEKVFGCLGTKKTDEKSNLPDKSAQALQAPLPLHRNTARAHPLRPRQVSAGISAYNYDSFSLVSYIL